MNILIFWFWAFGSAIWKHLSENNPHKKIFVYEKNEFTLNYLKTMKKHPYFCKWVKFSENIEFCGEVDYVLPIVDLVILTLPAQFVVETMSKLKDKFKYWVTFLNLSKWINNISLKTIGDWLKEWLEWLEYNYAVLSWWMIAQELVDWKIIWADIAIENRVLWEKIKKLFESKNFKICLTHTSIKNVELYWALKNIIAICMWYYSGLWLWASSLGYYMCKLIKEEETLIKMLWWEWNLRFLNYSLGWDLIATCFWDSRNRLLWELVAKWQSVSEVLEFMKKEKKTAEWYHTLKWIYTLTKWNDNFEEINKIGKIFFPI